MKLAGLLLAAAIALSCAHARTDHAASISPSAGGARSGNAELGYAGPSALGPFSMGGSGGGVTLRVLSAALQNPRLPSGHFLCYRDDALNAYLVIERATDDPSFSRGLSISAVPNCFGRTIYHASGFQHWKTELGIEIGSSEAQVRAAYPAVAEIDTDPSHWLAYFPGGHQLAAASNKSRGEAIFVYRASVGSADLREAEIGVRRGRVVWISLYRDE